MEKEGIAAEATDVAQGKHLAGFAARSAVSVERLATAGFPAVLDSGMGEGGAIAVHERVLQQWCVKPAAEVSAQIERLLGMVDIVMKPVLRDWLNQRVRVFFVDPVRLSLALPACPHAWSHFLRSTIRMVLQADGS